MKLSPLYLQWQEEALQEGEQRTMRLMVESMLETKFGSLDEALRQIVEPLSQLPARDCTQSIWQSSREALLERFRETT